MSNAFDELYERVVGVDIYDVASVVIDSTVVKDFIIDTIQDRIFMTGEVADGTELRTDAAPDGEFYSPNTVKIKKQDGKQTKNVTLSDSGEFYESWDVDVMDTFFEVKADFEKRGGIDHIGDNFTALFNSNQDFETQVLMFTDEEFDLFIKEIFKPRFLQVYKNRITNG